MIKKHPEIQKRGVSAIYYDVADAHTATGQIGLMFMLTLMSFSSTLPIRYSTSHFCICNQRGKQSVNGQVAKHIIDIIPRYF